MKRPASGEDSERRAPGCGRRLLIGCGHGLLALLLLVAALYVGEFYRCTRFTPTGDALYDRYARAVIRRQAWKLFHAAGMHPATLPDRLLAGWEDDFGSDPRYWQLRYWCALHCIDNYTVLSRHHPWEVTPGPVQSEADQYLIQAYERDVADADTLWFLFEEQRVTRRESWFELETEIEALPAGERRKKLQVQSQMEEQQELNLLNAMVGAGPDQAWPYYWRARYWFNLGEQDLARADLRAGNQAADNHIPRLFPVSAVYQSLDRDSAYGNQCVAGAVLEVYGYSAVPNWVKWQETGKEVEMALALGGDLGLASEFHRFACRLGQAGDAAAMELIYSELLIAMLPEYLLTELADGLTADERRALWKIYTRAKYIERTIMGTADQLAMQQPGYPLPSGLYPPISYWGTGEAAYSPATMREISWNSLDRLFVPSHLYRHLVWVHQSMRQLALGLKEDYAELEQVDYEDREDWTGAAWSDRYDTSQEYDKDGNRRGKGIGNRDEGRAEKTSVRAR